MKWLVISDNDKFIADLKEILLKQDKKAKLLSCGFSPEEFKKLKKDFANFATCVVYGENEKKVNYADVLQISGFFAAYNIPFLTNSGTIYHKSLFEKEGIRLFPSREELLKFIEKNIKKLEQESRKRLAKKHLLDRGIPYTSDCFATYIAKDKIEVVNEFLEAGMSINSRDDMGVPMLNIACRNDNFEYVDMFLNLGAELNATSDDRGYTAVMDAVWRGNEKITQMLIDRGADLNTINKEGQTNLILAVGADRLSLVKLLAENGADPDVKDMMGMSAYNYAILFKKEKIAEVLKPYHKE